MAQKDYLLDTNIIGYYAEMKTGCKSTECKALEKHLQGLSSDVKILLCSITAGEIQYGLLVSPNKDTVKQQQVLEVINAFAFLDINKNVAMGSYAKLRARLFDRYAPKQGRAKKRLEEWKDPTTSRELQIQENDLWICAVAMTYNLRLVTNDAMESIKAVAGNDIDFEDWLV